MPARKENIAVNVPPYLNAETTVLQDINDTGYFQASACLALTPSGAPVPRFRCLSGLLSPGWVQPCKEAFKVSEACGARHEMSAVAASPGKGASCLYALEACRLLSQPTATHDQSTQPAAESGMSGLAGDAGGDL